MNQLCLTPEECSVLEDIIQCYLEELHSEIIHTASFDYKDELKHRKQVLLDVISRMKLLEAPTAA
jgi:hypothetical protein